MRELVRKAPARLAPVERPAAPPSLADLDRELFARPGGFGRFIRAAFPHVDPGVGLVDDWYIDAIADHLEAVRLAMLGQPGGIKRLVINVQHRSLKSTIAGVMFPAWCWLRDPWMPFLTAARTQPLAIRDSGKMRRLIESGWFQDLIRTPSGAPAWTWSEDQNQKGDFLNTANGRRIATFRGGGTGYGGLGLIADDILSIQDSYSPTEIADANRWIEAEFYSRMNDPERSAIVLVMHRLHPEDPSAHALRLGWEHLCLPTEFDPARRRTTSIGWTDPRREAGESLAERRWTPAVIAEMKESLGPIYEAICNQNPQSRAGAVLAGIQDLPRWTSLPPSGSPRVSIDPSFKGQDLTAKKSQRSRVGIIDALATAPREAPSSTPDAPAPTTTRLYVTGHVCDFMDFARLVAETRAARARHPHAPVYVEDKANGPALMTSLQDQVAGLVPVNPDQGAGSGSKVERFIAIAHFLRSGSVLLPTDDYAPWVREFVLRLLAFPNVAYDDDIDALTQLVRMEFLEPGGAHTSIRQQEAVVERWSKML